MQSVLAGPLLRFEGATESTAVREAGRIVELKISPDQIAELAHDISETLDRELGDQLAEAREVRLQLQEMRNSRAMRIAHALGRWLPRR